MDIIQFVDDLTAKVTALAWSLFLLTWSLGWAIRGSPIPLSRLKRAGNSMIEDSVWAAFWLALGSTLFNFITWLVRQLAG